jgi:hypothetical protein
VSLSAVGLSVIATLPPPHTHTHHTHTHTNTPYTHTRTHHTHTHHTHTNTHTYTTHTHTHTQIAILRVLEKLEELQDREDNYKRAAIYTDSKITLDLLRNKFKRNRLIETIRNKINILTHLK